jgi:hypothetical protein
VRADARIYTFTLIHPENRRKNFEIAKKNKHSFFKELETPVHAPNAVPKNPALSRLDFTEQVSAEKGYLGPAISLIQPVLFQ